MGRVWCHFLRVYCQRDSLKGRMIQRFLWSSFLLLAALLAALDLFVAQADPALLYPALGASAAIVVLLAVLAYFFLRAFSAQASLLRAYVERLLDPQVFEEKLPADDGELGRLARSLQRTAPRIRELVESLKLEGARREAILASMVEGVLAVDRDLRVTFCNHSFARTVGARIPVAQGMALLELVRDPGLLEIMTKVLVTGQRVERRLILPAARDHVFEVLAGPLAGPATRGALAILHDITELERLERVRKDFVANVSHELRTPLAAIRGYAETLLEGALEDAQNKRRFVEIIVAQADRLTNIASDLLTISESRVERPQRRTTRYFASEGLGIGLAYGGISRPVAGRPNRLRGSERSSGNGTRAAPGAGFRESAG